jgi:O-antigen ligase
VALAIMLFFLHWKKYYPITLKRLAIVVILLAGGMALLFGFTNAGKRLELAYQETYNYITQASESKRITSMASRFEMWHAALAAFREAPVFGIGPGTFDDYLARLAKVHEVNRQVAEAWKVGEKYHPHTHAHNEYLNTLATRGIVGLGTLLLLFAYFLGKFIRLASSADRTRSSLGLAGILLLTGYLVFSLSESVLYHAMTANFFFLCLVSLLYLSRKRQDSPPSN